MKKSTQLNRRNSRPFSPGYGHRRSTAGDRWLRRSQMRTARQRPAVRPDGTPPATADVERLLVRQLQTMATADPVHRERQTVRLHSADGRVCVTTVMSDVSMMVCSCELLCVEFVGVTLGIDVMRAARRISNAVTYLLEPLEVWEVACDRSHAVVRSDPEAVSSSRLYYEILIEQGGRIRLRRLQECDGDVDQAAPATMVLPYAVLTRLVRDFVAAVPAATCGLAA